MEHKRTSIGIDESVALANSAPYQDAVQSNGVGHGCAERPAALFNVLRSREPRNHNV